MYQSYPHPVCAMASFPSNAVPTHSDIKTSPPPSSPFYLSALPSTTTALTFSMAPPIGWNDNTTFGAFMPSPEETYSPPPLPVMTTSAYQSPSSSNVSFEEDDMPIFFSPTTTVVAHSPCEFSPASTSAVSFYPSEQPSQHLSFLTSTLPSSAYCHHPPPTTKPVQPYDSHHSHEHYQQQHSLYYSKQHQNPLPLARPYSCPTCPRAFARKHDLQRHIRVHTGSKPYLCMGCKKPFARTDALKRHLRIEDACRLSPEIQALKGAGKRRYRNL